MKKKTYLSGIGIAAIVFLLAGSFALFSGCSPNNNWEDENGGNGPVVGVPHNINSTIAGGTAQAFVDGEAVAQAEQYDIVTLRLTPTGRNRLVSGSLQIDGGNITPSQSGIALEWTFPMPNREINITAEFEEAPALPAPASGVRYVFRNGEWGSDIPNGIPLFPGADNLQVWANGTGVSFVSPITDGLGGAAFANYYNIMSIIGNSWASGAIYLDAANSVNAADYNLHFSIRGQGIFRRLQVGTGLPGGGATWGIVNEERVQIPAAAANDWVDMVVELSGNTNVGLIAFTMSSSDGNSTEFWMDNIRFVPKPVFQVITESNPGHSGTVTATPNQGRAGTPISITVTENSGYRLQNITIVDADDAAVAATGTGLTRNFNMPRSHVTVTAVFESDTAQTFAITKIVEPTNGGTLDVSHTSASAGTAVTVSAAPVNNSFALVGITVQETSGARTVAVDDGTFLMPAFAVTVTAQFDRVMIYRVHDFNASGVPYFGSGSRSRTDSQPPFEGTHSMRLRYDASGYFGLHQVINLAGFDYITFWVRATRAGDNFRLRLATEDGAFNGFFVIPPGAVAPDEFTVSPSYPPNDDPRWDNTWEQIRLPLNHFVLGVSALPDASTVFEPVTGTVANWQFHRVSFYAGGDARQQFIWIDLIQLEVAGD